MREKIENIYATLVVEWNGLDQSKRKLFTIVFITVLSLLVYKTIGSSARTLYQVYSERKEILERIEICNADIAEIPRVQQLTETYRAKLESLSVAFSNKTDISTLLPPPTVRVNVLEFEPKKMVRSEGFSEVTLDLKYSGVYKNVVDYIEHIENVKVVTELKSLLLSSSHINPSQTQANLVLSIYLGPQADSTLVFSDYLPKKQKVKPGNDYNPEIVVQTPIYFSDQKTKRYAPLRRSVRKVKKKVNFSIDGFWLGRVPKLVVNGKIVKEGEYINGWRLAKIDIAESIAVFEKDGERKKVSF